MKAIQIGIFALLLGSAGSVFSAEILNVPQPIWDGLQAQQRALLGERFVINVRAGNTYGVIMDVQSLNESGSGSTAGSQLGAAYGSAAYVDNAFSGRPQNWNYSATNHLTAQVAGALIGSLANQPAHARFRTRYTIKNGNGGVEYIEEIKSDAFRHSMGLCVQLGPIRPIDLETCGLTHEQFLAKYSWLAAVNQQVAPVLVPPSKNMEKPMAMISPPPLPPPPAQLRPVVSVSEMVLCKFGVASPVRVSSSVCESAGGSVIP